MLTKTDTDASAEAEGPPSLADRGKSVMRAARKNWLWLALGAVVLLVLFSIFGHKKPTEPYRTAKIDRGTITRVVSATGTLQPIVSANVGSLVSAPVTSILVDFNSRVTAGQVLAQLDPTTFQQRIVQAQAGLAQAQAQAAVANADYARYERLNAAGFASSQLMNQQRAARDTQRAAVSQANAILDAARTDLSRATIRSPINGVVVDRQVNVGQVVQSSFSAATLFTIAQDLSRLQANITVDEADIGEVREGQDVRFTVDAFPDSEFEGRVSQVRQQGVDTNGVVSYTVVVQADNPGGRLLPGMTANAEIIIETVDNVLRLPSTALRFRPTDPALVAQGQALAGTGGRGQGGAQGASGGQGQGGGFGGGQGGAGRGTRGVEQIAEQLQLTDAQKAQLQSAMQAAMQSAMSNAGSGDDPSARRGAFRRVREQALAAIEPSLNAHQKQLLQQLRNAPPGQRRAQTRTAVAWVLRNNKPTPVRVQIGVADDNFTAIMGGELKEGDDVITGGGPRAATAPGQGANRQGGFGGPPGAPGGGGGRIRGT